VTRRQGGRDDGYALLMVLIALGLTAILLGEIESGAREQVVSAAGLRDQAAAQAAADGAVWTALWQVLPGRNDSWAADASPHDLVIGGAKVAVSAEDLADRVDLNRDSAAAVAVVLRGGGVDSATALALADKLVDWRTQDPAKSAEGAKLPEYRAAGLPYGPPNADYENLAETEMVLGITPAIARIVAVRTTIYSAGQPRPGAARDAVEQNALETALRSQPPPPPNPPVLFFYAITARAEVGSAVAIRHAVLRVDMDASNRGRFWRLLDWD